VRLAALGDFGLNADGYAPGPVSAATYDGQLYGLQPGANTLAIFYNKDVLAKAGVQPPKTWAELKTAAKKLTSGSSMASPSTPPLTTRAPGSSCRRCGPTVATRPTCKSPQVAEALQLWKDLVDDGSVSKSVVNWKQADVNDQFIAGKAAMMLNGPWQIPALQKAKADFGVAPFPINTPDQTSIAPLGGEAWTVTETGNKANMAKAAELVKCMNTDDNQMLRAKQGGLVPTKLALAEQYKKEVPSMAGFTDAVANAPRANRQARPEVARHRQSDLYRHAARAHWPGGSGRRDGQGRRQLTDGDGTEGSRGMSDAETLTATEPTAPFLRHRAGPQRRPARGTNREDPLRGPRRPDDHCPVRLPGREEPADELPELHAADVHQRRGSLGWAAELRGRSDRRTVHQGSGQHRAIHHRVYCRPVRDRHAAGIVLPQNFPLNGILRALFLLPWLIPLIVGSAAWRAMLEQDSGILNVTLENLGIIDAPIPWLTSPTSR
jgi:hypothetical protein